MHDYTHIVFLSDLSPLGNMPNLLELDASNNKITKLLDFTPPKNLKCVDLSFNLIEEMADLSAHHYLQKLCLDSILFAYYNIDLNTSDM